MISQLKKTGSDPNLDEKSNNVIHTQKNSQKFVENHPTDDIHDDHNFPIDELSGTNVETISTDHGTVIKRRILIHQTDH